MNHGDEATSIRGGVRLPVKDRERRFRVLRITPELLVNTLLSPVRVRDELVRVMDVRGLPENVEIDAVAYDDLRREFCFRLWHASFEPVPLGDVAPKIDVTVTMELLPAPGGEDARFVAERFMSHIEVARQELGEYCDPNRPLADCVRGMRQELEQLRATRAAMSQPCRGREFL